MSPNQSSIVDNFSSNMVAVFPYAGTDWESGVWNVLFGSSDVAAALAGLQSAISQTPASEMVNAFAVSGGSQALASAYTLLTSEQQNRIGNISYIIPGNFEMLNSLPGGNSGTAFFSGGGNDRLIPTGYPNDLFTTYYLSQKGCGHDVTCMLNEFSNQLRRRTGSSCHNHEVVTQASPTTRGTASSTIHYGGQAGNNSSNGVNSVPIIVFGGIDPSVPPLFLILLTTDLKPAEAVFSTMDSEREVLDKQQRRKKFPHPLSAWWIPCLLFIGWAPLLSERPVTYLFPAIEEHHRGAAFAMAWGLDVALPCMVLASLSTVLQTIRLVKWLVASVSR